MSFTKHWKIKAMVELRSYKALKAALGCEECFTGSIYTKSQVLFQIIKRENLCYQESLDSIFYA